MSVARAVVASLEGASGRFGSVEVGFTAMTLENAACVHAERQVDLVFTFIASHFNPARRCRNGWSRGRFATAVHCRGVPRSDLRLDWKRVLNPLHSPRPSTRAVPVHNWWLPYRRISMVDQSD